MASSKRSEGQDVRALKVDVPAALRLQLKREALELDVSVREYVQRILENRLPADVMAKVEEQAKATGMSPTELLITALRNAGFIS